MRCDICVPEGYVCGYSAESGGLRADLSIVRLSSDGFHFIILISHVIRSWSFPNKYPSPWGSTEGTKNNTGSECYTRVPHTYMGRIELHSSFVHARHNETRKRARKCFLPFVNVAVTFSFAPTRPPHGHGVSSMALCFALKAPWSAWLVKCTRLIADKILGHPRVCSKF